MLHGTQATVALSSSFFQVTMVCSSEAAENQLCLLEAFMPCPVVCSFTGKPHCIIFTSELSPLVTHLQRWTEPADASKVTSEF